MSGKKATLCSEGISNMILFAEERGVQRSAMATAEAKSELKTETSYPKEIERSQTEPIYLPRVVSEEMPFSDEDEDGPNSFIYYTVPSVIGEVAEERTKRVGVEYLMPELKKLAVRGELSDREKKVFRYFRSRLIMDLLQFLMNHLLTTQPENPIEYLRGILDQCLLYRSGHVKESPLLYKPEHLESLFVAFDPLKAGFISIEQYHTAMKTLMVRNYQKHPERDDNNNVPKRVFLFNAKMALEENLLDLILLTPSATEKPTKSFAMNATPGRETKPMTTKDDVNNYMKTLVRNMKDARDEANSPDEIVELEGIQKPPLKTPPLQQQGEKFGDYARPLKHLQQAFKPPSDFNLG